jgi:hypothetical protein
VRARALLPEVQLSPPQIRFVVSEAMAHGVQVRGLPTRRSPTGTSTPVAAHYHADF